MEYAFARTSIQTLQLLSGYLKIKLELVPIAIEQKDWSYNHRMQRMLFDFMMIVPHGPEIDISDICIELFKVRPYS